MTPIFHPLRVRAVEPDTAEAVIVSFDVPEDLRAVFGFSQGQYLTLRKEIDGQDLRRRGRRRAARRRAQGEGRHLLELDQRTLEAR
jgi:hypothetical protein